MAEEAELSIYGEIGPSFFGMIDDLAVLSALGELKAAKKINVRINSPGGDAFMGVSIMNALRRHPAKIVAHIDALAASAASIVAMGADKIVMHEGSMMMVHRAWTIAIGNSSEMAKVADTLAKVDSNIVDIYAHRSGLDAAKVKQLVDDETWMKAQEAVDLGFADEADSISTGQSAKVPQGWYGKAPDTITRYTPDSRKAAAMTGLSIAAKSIIPPELADRRAQLERIKTRLLAA